MAQLWGGRFTKETDKLVYNFNASISFDQKFYEQDIRGSKAHVAMLARQGILTAEEKDQIEAGLDGILAYKRVAGTMRGLPGIAFHKPVEHIFSLCSIYLLCYSFCILS